MERRTSATVRCISSLGGYHNIEMVVVNPVDVDLAIGPIRITNHPMSSAFSTPGGPDPVMNVLPHQVLPTDLPLSSTDPSERHSMSSSHRRRA